MRAKLKDDLEEVKTQKVALVLISDDQQTQGVHKELDVEIERMAAGLQALMVSLYAWTQGLQDRVALRASNR
jgi:hypothetical protein